MAVNTPVKIKLSLAVKPDDPAYVDSGDRAKDAELKSRVNQGDVWAWAHVKVEARTEVDGQTFVGHASLARCSYRAEEDFKNSGRWKDLKHEVIDNLWQEVIGANRRGLAAITLLLLKQRGAFEIEEGS